MTRDDAIIGGSLKLGYEFIRGYTAFVRGAVDHRRYDNLDAFNPLDRDSDGYLIWDSTAIARDHRRSGSQRGRCDTGRACRHDELLLRLLGDALDMKRILGIVTVLYNSEEVIDDFFASLARQDDVAFKFVRRCSLSSGRSNCPPAILT